eukprot:1804365-Rhodomonas_salina.4
MGKQDWTGRGEDGGSLDGSRLRSGDDAQHKRRKGLGGPARVCRGPRKGGKWHLEKGVWGRVRVSHHGDDQVEEQDEGHDRVHLHPPPALLPRKLNKNVAVLHKVHL